MTLPYTPWNWYWVVAGDFNKVFSSKVGDYVPTSSDAMYAAWKAGGNVPSQIGSEQELAEVLTVAAVPLGVLGDTTEISKVPMWALKAALAAFAGGDKEAAYTTWITANKATRVNLFYQWQCGNNVERKSALIASIVNNTGMTPAQMSAVYRDAKKRANGAGVS